MTTASRPTVLIVDDEADLRATVAESLSAEGFAVAEAENAADAHERLRAFAYDALVIDLRLPDADGMDVLDAALTRYPDVLAVMMTGFGGVAEAVAAMKRGAIDFLIKPFQLAQLSRVLNGGLEQRRLRQENAELRAQLRDRYRFDAVIGQSVAMQQMFSTLELVAPMNSTVLIQGETGTGKELIARTVHHNSPRADQRFVAFNAAAIPESLAEAELFGHAKGAFTGAVSARVGRFELAHRGTLFIDEVALMTPSLQAKLLRALQEREFERVGESRSVKFDARIIAATNTDLRRLVKEGQFREDLYYRLNVIPLTLPPLRERRDDIPLLARHFLRRANHPGGEKRLAPEALDLLKSYAWPGNIRELQNMIESAVIIAEGAEVQARDLPVVVRGQDPQRGLDLSENMSLEDLERRYIGLLLERLGGHRAKVAKVLQISERNLYRKLRAYHLADASVGGRRRTAAAGTH
jgi:DNA-binding NtrC family response regulator